MNKRAENIAGGMASGKSPAAFDAKAIEKGKKVEMEHTNKPRVAQEIAMDHLTESPEYYEELEKMEKKLEEKKAACADFLNGYFCKVAKIPGEIQEAEKVYESAGEPLPFSMKHPVLNPILWGIAGNILAGTVGGGLGLMMGSEQEARGAQRVGGMLGLVGGVVGGIAWRRMRIREALEMARSLKKVPDKEE